MAERMMTVEVVYLDVDHQYRRSVEVAEGSTVLEAIDASGIAQYMAAVSFDPNELDLGRLDATKLDSNKLDSNKFDSSRFDPSRLGIFSTRVSVDHVVKSADRIEIYRPLILDPMEARRRRAL